jgi:hypothetical protein
MQIATRSSYCLDQRRPEESTSYAIKVNAGYSLLDSLEEVTGVYGGDLSWYSSPKTGALERPERIKNR